MKASKGINYSSRQVANGARRGVSLIEALVAMAVMAFGMLGVLGMQATLRANADLSKQRSEATRLAEERLEAWRSFSVIGTTALTKAYQDIVTPASETLTSFVSNTTYTRTGVVTESSPVGHKTLVVDVSWADRGGNAQNVRLFSAVAQISPDLGATAVAPAQGAGGMREPGGRARGIPPQAKNFGDGTSGFRPPQTTGTVAWLFNNTTGLIQSVCTTVVTDNALLTLASLTGCSSAQPYQLLSGYIRFALGGTQPTATTITNPGDAPAPATIEAEVVQTVPSTLAATQPCFHGVASNYVEYFCALPVLAVASTSPVEAALTWSGALQIKPATLPTLSGSLADVAAANRKVCRYRAAASYTGVNLPSANQNLVVMRAGDGSTAFTCPSPPSFAHQPAT